MKSLFLLCILMCFTLVAQSSTSSELKQGSISGTIIDAHLNQPIPYVTIVIKNASKETITGAITHDDGSFKITKLPACQLLVTIQYIGFKTIIQPFSIGKETYAVNLGKIPLKENTAALDEITLVAEVSSLNKKWTERLLRLENT